MGAAAAEVGEGEAKVVGPDAESVEATSLKELLEVREIIAKVIQVRLEASRPSAKRRKLQSLNA